VTIAKYTENYDSGLAWLGAVPKHWSLKRLGHFFSERREKVSDKEFQPLSVTKHGIVPRLETAAKTQDGDNRKRVIAGDFVINSRSDRKGSSGLSELDGSVSLICIVLEPDGVYGRFAHHLLRSEVFQEEFYRNGKGIVADLWSTGFSEMKNIVIPVPSQHEQTQIARFLDHETAKIDALIREQERLIELLQEKRQAVISHAVTKGLDPDVPMKDSGVEWLGEVPAHWRVMKFLRCVRIAEGQVDPKLSPYSDMILIAPNHVQSQTGRILETETAETQGAESGKYVCKPGDVIYSKIRPALRKACIIDYPALCSADMYPLRPSEQLTGQFLLWSILSEPFSRLAILESERVAMPKINRESINEIYLAVPPVDEQRGICKFITDETKRLDDLSSVAHQSMGILKERRSALISAAVTGKIDVRDWQPPVDESAFDEEVRQAGIEATT